MWRRKSAQVGNCELQDPGLLDLGHSDPYMHNGRFDSLEAVMRFYKQVSAQARAGKLRNGDPRIRNIALSGQDTQELVAFLRLLNEDYN